MQISRRPAGLRLKRSEGNPAKEFGSDLREDLVVEQFVGRLGRDGVRRAVDRHADALAAVAHAEFSAQLDLVGQIVLGDELLEAVHDALRSQQMAGAADTDGNLHFNPFLSDVF